MATRGYPHASQPLGGLRWRRAAAAAAIAAVAGLAGCSESQPPAHLSVTGGDPERGRSLIQRYGCGACHVIAGIRGARGQVGPPLVDYAQRHLLAGILPNAPRTLIPWLMDPVALAPQTGMPAMGISEGEARHIAAYLYTLGAGQAAVYPSDPPLDLRRTENPIVLPRHPSGGDTTQRTRRMERGLIPAEGETPRI